MVLLCASTTSRIATQVDTIVHTFLSESPNSVTSTPGPLHEINVIGTLNLLGRGRARAGSSVRQVVVKSSTHVYGSAETDPAWFREEDSRQSPVRTRVERSLIEVDRWSATSPRTTRTWWYRCSGSPMCSGPTSSPR